MRSALLSTHHYIVNGLKISSGLRLPELTLSNYLSSQCQAKISLGEISDTQFLNKQSWLVSENKFQSVQMKIKGVARYQIKNGNEILVDPIPGASDREVRLFLLGSAFGILLHQRGILPLHASAVKVGNTCVAFLGESGAGKSTLAAHLNSLNYKVMSDDVCAVSFFNEKPFVWPGVPRIKLWSDAIDRLGYSDMSLVQDSFQDNKFHLPIDETDNNQLPLTRLYELCEVSCDKACSIKKLTGQEKMQVLMKNIYRQELIEDGDIRKHIFLKSAAILNKTEVFRLSRSKNFNHMDDCILALKNHWAENTAGKKNEY